MKKTHKKSKALVVTVIEPTPQRPHAGHIMDAVVKVKRAAVAMKEAYDAVKPLYDAATKPRRRK